MQRREIDHVMRIDRGIMLVTAVYTVTIAYNPHVAAVVAGRPEYSDPGSDLEAEILKAEIFGLRIRIDSPDGGTIMDRQFIRSELTKEERVAWETEFMNSDLEKERAIERLRNYL